MKKIFTNAAEAFKCMKKQPWNAIVSVIADLLTIFLFIGAFQLYRASIEGRVERVLVNLVNPAGQTPYDILSIVVATAVFYVALYLVWVGLQSVSWYKAYQITGIKKKYRGLLKRFAIVNIVWIIVAALINTLHDFISVINTLANEIFFKQTYVNGFFAVIALIAAYFLAISYIHKKTLVVGVKKANIIISAYLFIALTILIIHYLMVLGSWIHPMLDIVMGIGLFLPAITWAKIYLIINVKEV